MTTAIPPAFQSAEMADWEPWIGYIRVSTWREEKISPEIQRAAILAWAARTKRRIIDFVEDLDMTGRNFKRKIMECLAAVEAGCVRGVAVWMFSRFGRNMLGVKINLARLEDAGGQLESATEPVDARTAVGELQRDLLFAFAAFESNRAGEQWRDTHALRVASGVPATGRQRFGYLWTPRRIPDPTSPTGFRVQQEGYRLDPDHAPIYDELYERKIEEHDGFHTLSRWLTEDLLIPAPRGGPWRQGTVKNMLDSGFAAGLLRTHDPKCRCPYRTIPRGEKRPPECTEGRMLYVPGAHPAAITPDRWAAYLHHRQQTRNTPPRARNATYPLTRLVHHGLCRSRISAGTGTLGGTTVRGYAYICTAHKDSPLLCPTPLHVRRDLVESEVRAWLAEQIDPGTGTVAAEVIPDRPAAPVPDYSHVRAELARVEKALTRATVEHAKGVYDDGEYVAVRDALRAERDTLTARLARAAEVAALPTRGSLRTAMATLLETWPYATPAEQNRILHRVLRRVVIHDERTEGRREYGFRLEIHAAWEDDPWDAEKDAGHPSVI